MGLGFRVPWGLGFRVPWGLGFRVKGLGKAQEDVGFGVLTSLTCQALSESPEASCGPYPSATAASSSPSMQRQAWKLKLGSPGLEMSDWSAKTRISLKLRNRP